MIEAIVLFYLFVLSFFDIREKKVPAWMIIAGVTGAMVFFVSKERLEGADLIGISISFFENIVPGFFFLAAAVVTGKVGIADGMLLTAMGLVLGARNVLFACCIGLWILAVCSGILLMQHRIKRDTKLPCIPFLAAGQIVEFLLLLR